MKIYLIFGSLLFLSSAVAFSDVNSDLEFIHKHQSKKNNSETTTLSQSDTSEAGAFFQGLIKAYQIVLSSQDKPQCNFIPSCSHFSQQAIKSFGIVQGALMTSDRLQRCNGTKSGYKIDKKTGLALDPIENYSLWSNQHSH